MTMINRDFDTRVDTQHLRRTNSALISRENHIYQISNEKVDTCWHPYPLNLWFFLSLRAYAWFMWKRTAAVGKWAWPRLFPGCPACFHFSSRFNTPDRIDRLTTLHCLMTELLDPGVLERGESAKACRAVALQKQAWSPDASLKCLTHTDRSHTRPRTPRFDVLTQLMVASHFVASLLWVRLNWKQSD